LSKEKKDLFLELLLILDESLAFELNLVCLRPLPPLRTAKPTIETGTTIVVLTSFLYQQLFQLFHLKCMHYFQHSNLFYLKRPKKNLWGNIRGQLKVKLGET